MGTGKPIQTIGGTSHPPWHVRWYLTKPICLCYNGTMTKRIVDQNNFWVIEKNPISAIGVFPYAAFQLGLDDPEVAEKMGVEVMAPNDIVMVYRSEEELSSPKTIASFKLLPWVDDHAFLGPKEDDLTPAEEKGVAGVTGEKIVYERPFLYANLKMFSESLKTDIEDGKVELSPAYRCDYHYSPGVFEGKEYRFVQTNLLGNHLALVDSGRTGKAVKVLDAAVDSPAGVAAAAVVSSLKNPGQHVKGLKAMSKKVMDAAAIAKKKADARRLAMDSSVEKLKELLPAFTEYLSKFLSEEAGEPEHQGEPAAVEGEEPAAASDEHAPAKAFMDALTSLIEGVEPEAAPAPAAGVAEAEPAAEPAPAAPAASTEDNDDMPQADCDMPPGAKAADKALTPEQLRRSIYADVALRDDLYNRVSKRTGAFQHAAMDSAQVAEYGIKKLGLKAPKGAEIAVLDAFLKGGATATATAAKTITMAQDAAVSECADIQNYINGEE